MVDQMVLQAQQWVNSTYKGVYKFVAAPEDGKTSWSTMYALTMALQKELGITELSAAFGPTTQSKFSASGELKLNDNNNKVKILQAALYCKGYNPGGLTGKYGPGTAEAVRIIMGNMGLSVSNTTPSTVTTKLMKALLTMDAYTLLAGGNPSVRELQKYLNNKYIGRSEFFVGPCDGLFSRGTQQSLMYAIQYELGMSDSQANGFFGPATQSGLNKVASGSSLWAKPSFIPLFTGALAANGFGKFSTEKYSGLDVDIKHFQEKCMLTVNGLPDYETWCETLVSTGDPSRTVDTIDTRFEITDKWAAYLKGKGIKYVARYLDENDLSTDQTQWFKKMRPSEPQRIIDNGLILIPFSQLTTADTVSVTGNRGQNHAERTLKAAQSYKIPAGSTIYFAIDFDATDDQITNLVIPYFQQVASYMASHSPRYIVGVYGTRNICARVMNERLAAKAYISGISYGWSGNLGFSLPDGWAFNQINTVYAENTPEGFAYDKVVRSNGDFADAGVSKLNAETSINNQFFKYTDYLYSKCVELKFPNPTLSTINFMRRISYGDGTFAMFLGDLDTNEINKLNPILLKQFPDMFTIDAKSKQKVSIPPMIVDYRTGTTIDPQHISATGVGEYRRTSNPTNLLQVVAGEYLGWAGDLVTFFGDYINNVSSYASSSNFADEMFAKFSGSSFKYSDLLEDALGFGLAEIIASKTNPTTYFKKYLESYNTLNPINILYSKRFNSNVDTLYKCCLTALAANNTGSSNTVFVAALLKHFNYPVYSLEASYKVQDLCKTIANIFSELAK